MAEGRWGKIMEFRKKLKGETPEKIRLGKLKCLRDLKP